LKEHEWKLRYTPHGYRYARSRISFETLGRARFPADILALELDRLVSKMEHDVEGAFYASVFTRLSVFPKDTGETLNHLDPLTPRFGIEIEVRQAAAR
jgi:hypothetical protein